jgi:aerobic carbon-monoxide dehydrogenase medium subunit
MYDFKYERAESVDQAVKMIQDGGQLLAGGQTLLASMKQRLTQPEALIDLGHMSELTGIKQEGSNFVIGAMTRHQDVAKHAGIQQHIPGLAHLAGGIGDKQIRAMGTIGGSLANNDPAACYPSAVMALDATIHTNTRAIKADDYFLGMFSTALEPDEVITAVSFPIPKKSAYAKFKQPASRYALVGVFVAQTEQGVRVAVTGAGDGVFRHAELEQALNTSFTAAAVDNIKVDASELSSDLHASAAYRASLIVTQTQRAVDAALAA